MKKAKKLRKTNLENKENRLREREYVRFFVYKVKEANNSAKERAKAKK